MKSNRFRCLAPFIAGLFLVPAGFAAPEGKPNVVFILADDLGWRDLHCTGNPWVDSPNLDRLATQGTRFTAAYAAAPICTASRAALLTGRSPARLGFEFVIKEKGIDPPSDHPIKPPPYPLNLPLAEVTLAEAIGPAGYATGFFGKWHLAQHNGGYLRWSTTFGPLQQGYAEGSEDFGSHPYGDAARTPSEMRPFASGNYGRDTLTERAIGFLREHRGERFYLHLSEYYVHEPYRSRAAWLVQKYAARLPADASHERAIYYAMVETMDHLIGDVLQAIDDLGLTDQTLVVFTSDNGGHPIVSANSPLRGSKWNLYEAGLRVPWIIRWPGHVPVGKTSDAPFIGTDLLPTLCAATGAPLPAHVTLDGRNVLPLWLGTGAADPERAFTWHFPYYHPEGAAYAKALPRAGVEAYALSQTHPQSAIRVGDWKLIHFYEDGHDELYQPSNDPSEAHDLDAREPARAKALRARLDADLKESGARMPERR